MIKPMLASAWSQCESFMKFPILCSPKMDGIRAILFEGKLYSRSGKLIPNLSLQSWASKLTCENPLDGELMLMEHTGRPASFNAVQSLVMSEHGEMARYNFCYMVFDTITPHEYVTRLQICSSHVKSLSNKNIILCEVHYVESSERLFDTLSIFLKNGYEGMILRNPAGLYKHGRATPKSLGMVKLKPLEDAEATVVGVEPLYQNFNPQEISELGYYKRSHSKEGMVKTDLLGALICENFLMFDVPFHIGTGFTDEQRRQFWADRHNIIGKTVTFTYQKYGTKDRPRIPVFKAFRHELDIS